MATRGSEAGAPPLAFTASQRWILTVVFVGIISTTFPMTVLSVSLPDIAEDVGMSPAGITWVVTGPLLANVIATPILGKVGDMYGHRQVFIGGFALATVCALATAFSWNGESLIGFRTLGQLCGAATTPSGMAIIMRTVPREHRLRAVSWWAAAASLGPTLGLVIGGPLIDAIGWRALFIVQSIPAAVCLVFAVCWLPWTERRRGASFDIPGAMTLGLALITLLLGIDRGAAIGWTSPFVVGCLVVAPVSAVAFAVVERRATHPLLPFHMLSHRNVAAPLASQPFVMAPFQGSGVVVPFLLASELGFGTTAITVVALCRVVAFGSGGTLAGRIGTRYGERAGAATGTGILVVAMGVMAGGAVAGSIALLVLGMTLMGAGAGSSRTPFTASLANAVDESEMGIATATFNLSGQVGSSLGVTTMTAVMTAVGGTEGYAAAFLLGGLSAVLSVIFAMRLESSPRTGVATVLTSEVLAGPTVDGASTN